MSAVRLTCGIDEAGRGPLAGPVFAAAVILHPARRISGLDDSKKLAASTRSELAGQIREHALAWAIASASVAEIDAFNILQATLLAMQRAVGALAVAPHRALIDGLHCPRLEIDSRVIETRAIVAGDAKIKSISAASILAKTARDAEMVLLAHRYPQYGFERHKGYATPEHLAALRRHGPCDAYRQSFAPVRVLVVGGGQRDLFSGES